MDWNNLESRQTDYKMSVFTTMIHLVLKNKATDMNIDASKYLKRLRLWIKRLGIELRYTYTHFISTFAHSQDIEVFVPLQLFPSLLSLYPESHEQV